MNEEERLNLNNYIESLYQAMQIGDIKFESKHSYELYNLINKLLEENQQLKEKLEASEKARKEAIEYINKNLTISSILDGKKEYCLNNYNFDYRKLLNILDIDKGEIINGQY